MILYDSQVKFILPYYVKSTQAGSSERPCGHPCQLHQIPIPKQSNKRKLKLGEKLTQTKQCYQLSTFFIKKKYI